jgi:hypothetical protein
MLAIQAKRKADKRIRWLAFFAAKKQADFLLLQIRKEIEDECRDANTSR